MKRALFLWIAFISSGLFGQEIPAEYRVEAEMATAEGKSYFIWVNTNRTPAISASSQMGMAPVSVNFVALNPTNHPPFRIRSIVRSHESTALMSAASPQKGFHIGKTRGQQISILMAHDTLNPRTGRAVVTFYTVEPEGQTNYVSNNFSFDVKLPGKLKKVTNEEIVTVAKKEAAKLGWKEVEAQNPHFENGNWRVLVWQLPHKPGGFVTIDVSKEGKVVSVQKNGE